MALRKPQAVFFDLDGTLVDTAPDLAWSIDATLSALQLPTCGEDKVRGWIGSGIEGLLKRALTGDINGKPAEPLYQQALSIFKDIYIDNLDVRSRIYPGVREALASLQADNIKLACVTNKTARFSEKLLHSLGLFDEFGIVVSGDTLAVKKPQPEPLWHAASHFAIDPAQCLMVGDSLTDIRAARAAAMQVLCVPYGYNMGRDIHALAPDAVLENLAELPALFG